MEKSVHLEQKKSAKAAAWIFQIAAAFLLTMGTVGMMLDLTGNMWAASDMFSGSYTGGAIRLWDDFANVMGTVSYTLLPKYMGADDYSGLFVTVMALLIFMFSLVAVVMRKKWTLLIYVLPAALLPLITDIGPMQETVMFLAAGIIMALINIRFEGKASLTGLVPVVLVCVITAFTANTAAVSQIMNVPELATELNDKAHKIIDDFRYGKNPLGEGDMQIESREGIDGWAMEITMEEPQSLYLRGFVGESYTEGKWTQLAPAVYYARLTLTRQLDELDFSALTQLSDVGTLAEDGGASAEGADIAIKTDRASSRYLYLPYELKDTDIEDSKNWGDSFTTGEGFFGSKEYSYSASANKTGHWTDLYGRLFTMDAFADETLSRYYIAESHSNADIYDKYTQMTQSEVLALRNAIGEPGNQEKGHIDYKEAISKVMNYLDENITYKEDVDLTDSDNFLKDFFEQGEGFDVHYATAASLMFRYYGIPARYVEGYIVSTQDAEDMKAGEPYQLPLSNAHAWTEIYIDGLGWVPIETVAQYREITEQADLSKGLENQTNLNPFDTPSQLNNSGSQTQQEEEQDHIEEQTPVNILTIILLLLLLLIAIFIAIKKLRAQAVMRRWKREFLQADVNLGVSSIYAFMKEQDLNVTREVKLIGDAAAFGRERRTENDRRYMLIMLDIMKKEKRENEKKNSKTAKFAADIRNAFYSAGNRLRTGYRLKDRILKRRSGRTTS